MQQYLYYQKNVPKVSEITFKVNQELKAFRKKKKKTYVVQSSTKLYTPWLRTLHPTFSLYDLNIRFGDKIVVSILSGSDTLTRNPVLSTEEETVYNHEIITGNFPICNSGLLLEFESIPEVLYFTVVSKRIYEESNNCNC